MKYSLCFIMLVMLLVPSVFASETHNITGLWLSKKGDVAVRIKYCGDTLCGKIAWLSPHKNPYSITGSPLCQTDVLSGFSAQTPDQKTWKNGKIYKADKDKHYNAVLTLNDTDILKLRAYIGVPSLGKTKTFTRTTTQAYPTCNIPHSPHIATKLQDIAPASGNLNN